MILKAYTVFDVAAGVYDRPFFAHSDKVALRSFADIAVNKDHPIGQHPEDYSLFAIGEYDDNTGVIKGRDRECLATALEMVSQAQRVDSEKVAELELKVGGTE